MRCLVLATTVCLFVCNSGCSTKDRGLRSGTYGAEGFLPNHACYTVHVAGRLVAQGRASSTGSLAARFAVRGNPRGQRIEVRHAAGSIELSAPGSTEATIAYEPMSYPLVGGGGGTTYFSGSLDAVAGSTSIIEGWIVDWGKGEVERIQPSPVLNVPFAASLSGEGLRHVSVASVHESGSAGGCYWPQSGGSGLAATCQGGRGCTRIAIRERNSGLGGPELPELIPIGPAPPVPVDPPMPADAGHNETGPM